MDARSGKDGTLADEVILSATGMAQYRREIGCSDMAVGLSY